MWCKIFKLKVNKTYGVTNWRSDLKKVLKMAGSEYKQVAFLFTDLQIKEDTFLEDISMILNTGEVMNLHQMSLVIMTKWNIEKCIIC